MITTNPIIMFKYFFEGMAFIPTYGDVDFFQMEIQAESEDDAVEQLKERMNYMKGWTLVNVEPLETEFTS